MAKLFLEEQLFWFGYYHLMDISQQFMRKSSMKIDHIYQAQEFQLSQMNY